MKKFQYFAMVDGLYGLLILTAVVAFFAFGSSPAIVGYVVGTGIGYFLHVLDKVMLFNYMQGQSEHIIKEEASNEIESAVEKEVEEQSERLLKEEVRDVVRNENQNNEPDSRS